MNQSEQVNELFGAMSAAQAELRNPVKNMRNSHFKNEYADLTSVLDAIRPVISSHGLSIIQSVDMIDERVTIQTQINHQSGQWIKCSAMVPIPETKNICQTIGTISTYLRRYQALSMVGIATSEDDDDAQSLTTDRIGFEDQTPQRVAHLDALLDSTKSSRSKFLEAYGVAEIKHLTDVQFDAAIKQLQEKKRRQTKQTKER